MGEEIIKKVSVAEIIKAISLRHFNPVGAHVLGLIGELQFGFPCNLMPFVTHAVIGKQKQVTFYSNDYNTTDGS